MDMTIFSCFFNIPRHVSTELDVELAGWIHAILKYTTFTTDNFEFNVDGIIDFAKDFNLAAVLNQLIKHKYTTFADVYGNVQLSLRTLLQPYYSSTYELPYDKIRTVIIGDIWLADRIIESNSYNRESFIRTVIDIVVDSNIYNIDRWLIHLKSKIPEIDVTIVDAFIKHIASRKITLNIRRDSESVSKLVNILIKVYPQQMDRLIPIILEKALIFAYTSDGVEVLQYFMLRVSLEKSVQVLDSIFRNGKWWNDAVEIARNTLVVWCNQSNMLSADTLTNIIVFAYNKITYKTLNELCQTNNFMLTKNMFINILPRLTRETVELLIESDRVNVNELDWRDMSEIKYAVSQDVIALLKHNKENKCSVF